MPTRATRKRTTQVVNPESEIAPENRKEYEELLENFDKHSKEIGSLTYYKVI